MCGYIYIYINQRTHTYVYINIYIHVYIYIYIFTYVCKYVETTRHEKRTLTRSRDATTNAQMLAPTGYCYRRSAENGRR